jgi:hypothetical protein
MAVRRETQGAWSDHGPARVDPVLAVDRLEHTLSRRRLRRAEHENTLGAQHIVKHGTKPLIERGIEIHQQIAAADEIEPGERWIFDFPRLGGKPSSSRRSASA